MAGLLPEGTNFTGSLALSATATQTVSLLAASPGAMLAMGLRERGRLAADHVRERGQSSTSR